MSRETVGVPTRLLQEFVNRKAVVTVDTATGEVYRGKLQLAEENMNLTLNDVDVTFISGQTCKMENVYIKGQKIRLIQLPESSKEYLDMLAGGDRRPGGSSRFRGGRGGGGRGGGGRFDRRRN